MSTETLPDVGPRCLFCRGLGLIKTLFPYGRGGWIARRRLCRECQGTGLAVEIGGQG